MVRLIAGTALLLNVAAEDQVLPLGVQVVSLLVYLMCSGLMEIIVLLCAVAGEDTGTLEVRSLQQHAAVMIQGKTEKQEYAPQGLDAHQALAMMLVVLLRLIACIQIHAMLQALHQ